VARASDNSEVVSDQKEKEDAKVRMVRFLMHCRGNRHSSDVAAVRRVGSLDPGARIAGLCGQSAKVHVPATPTVSIKSLAEESPAIRCPGADHGPCPFLEGRYGPEHEGDEISWRSRKGGQFTAETPASKAGLGTNDEGATADPDPNERPDRRSRGAVR
jgi:hypothetical protein